MTTSGPGRANPLAAWRANPFFVLGVAMGATHAEIERAGQKALALLAVGAEGAAFYDTPFGPALRDGDAIRAALATLRDPVERVVHETLLELTFADSFEPCAPPEWTAAVEDLARSASWLR